MSSLAPRPHATPGQVRRERLLGWLCAGIGAVAFSGKAIVAKLMYGYGADAIAVVTLRMAIALPMFAAMAWVGERQGGTRLQRSHLSQLIGLGFCGYYLASTLDFLGLQYISASLERAILYLNPSIVLLITCWRKRQRLTLLQGLPSLLAYGGVGLIWLQDVHRSGLLAKAQPQAPWLDVALGSTLVLLSAISYAVYLVGSGQLVPTLGSMRLVGLASCVACGMCLLQWLVVHVQSHGTRAVVVGLPWQVYALSALNASVCTVLPVWLVMRGVQILGAAAAAQVGLVGPLATIWMAAVWLDEPVTWRLGMGTLAVLVGMVMLVRQGAPRTAVAALKPATGRD